MSGISFQKIDLIIAQISWKRHFGCALRRLVT